MHRFAIVRTAQFLGNQVIEACVIAGVYAKDALDAQIEAYQFFPKKHAKLFKIVNVDDMLRLSPLPK